MLEAPTRTDLSDILDDSASNPNPKLPQISGIDSKTKVMVRKKLWSESLGLEAAKNLSKQEIKRQEVIFEIISTEEDYVNDLLSIVRLYLKPLEANGLVKSKELGVIFSNIEQILPVNQELLLELQTQQAASPVIDTVGEILIRMSDYLKIYKSYCSNYPHSVEKVSAIRQTKAVAKFLDSVASQPESRSLDLNSFLLKPVQRVCKYPLLVRDLIKATPENHKDYEILSTAMSKIESVVSLINESTRKVENSEKILEMQSKFTTKVALVAAHRIILKSGPIHIDSGSAVKKRDYHLFNDLLILTKKDGTKLKIIMMTGFDELSVLDKNEDGMQLELVVRGHDSLMCKFDSVACKNEWKNLVETAISEWMTQGLKNRINQAHALATLGQALQTTSSGQDNASKIANSQGASIKAKAAVMLQITEHSKNEKSNKVAKPIVLKNDIQDSKTKTEQLDNSKNSVDSNSAGKIINLHDQAKAALMKQIAQQSKVKSPAEESPGEKGSNPVAHKLKPNTIPKPSPSPAFTNSILKGSAENKVDSKAKKLANTENRAENDQKVADSLNEKDRHERSVKKVNHPPKPFNEEGRLEDLINKYPSDANSVRNSISIRKNNEKLLEEEVQERRSTSSRPNTINNTAQAKTANTPDTDHVSKTDAQSKNQSESEDSYLALLIVFFLISLLVI